MVNKYNNTDHSTTKMKPADVTSSIHIEFNKGNNKEYSKYQIHVRISKYEIFLAKGYTLNWSEEVFVIEKVKNTVLWRYVISDRNNEEVVGTCFTKRNCKK